MTRETPGTEPPEPADGDPTRERSVVRRLRAVLAEPSSRGRRASYVLAALVVLAAGGILFWFFPRQEAATVVVRLPANAPIDRGRPLEVWPGTRVRVEGDGLSHASGIAIETAGTVLRRAATSTSGAFRVLVTVPPETPPGRVSLQVEDAGTGRVAARTEIVVRDRAVAGLALQATTLQAGERLALAGGGFRSGARVVLALDPGTSEERPLLVMRARRLGQLAASLVLPPGTPAGDHAIGALDGAGAQLAPAAPFTLKG